MATRRIMMSGPRRLRVAHWLLLAVAALVQSNGPAAADTSVAASVSASAAATDNISLTPSASSGQIYQLLPGVSMRGDTQHWHGSLDYHLTAAYFSGGEHGHDLFHAGSLFSDAELLPNWFKLDFGGTRRQTLASTAGTIGLGTYLPTGYIANSTAGSVTPILEHAFRAVRVEARFTRGFTHNDQPTSQIGYIPTAAALVNTDVRSGAFTLSSPAAGAQFTWQGSYGRQEVRYAHGVAPRFLSENATLELGLLTTPALRLIGRGGEESDLHKNISRGGLQSVFWAAGFDWSPGPSNELRALAGRRFFGNSYEVSWRWHSRLLALEARYDEQPTTQDNSLTALILPPTPRAPGPEVAGFVRLGSDVYVLKRLQGGVSLTGRITEIGVSVATEQRSYLSINGSIPVGPDLSDRFRSATAYATRRLGADLQAGLVANYTHVEVREGSVPSYRLRRYSASLTDRLGSRSFASLGVEHDQRTNGPAYKLNMVTLSGTFAWGGPVPAGFPIANLAGTNLAGSPP